MLSLLLIFVTGLATGSRPDPYPLLFRLVSGEPARLSLFLVYLWIRTPREQVPEKQPVPVTLNQDIALIYCYSIRQRAQSLFRHLYVCTAVSRVNMRCPACLLTSLSCCQIHFSPVSIRQSYDFSSLPVTLSMRFLIFLFLF